MLLEQLQSWFEVSLAVGASVGCARRKASANGFLKINAEAALGVADLGELLMREASPRLDRVRVLLHPPAQVGTRTKIELCESRAVGVARSSAYDIQPAALAAQSPLLACWPYQWIKMNSLEFRYAQNKSCRLDAVALRASM